MPEVDKKTLKAALRCAIVDCGYRALDTSEFYHNESIIGDVLRPLLRNGTISRSELFVTTKLWPASFREPGPVETLKKQLADLGLDYVDMYLMHYPFAFHYDGAGNPVLDLDISPENVWDGLEDCVKLGLTRSIGGSNFSANHISRLIEHGAIQPAMNQVESHPFFSNSEIIKFCQDRKVGVTVFSPFGNPGYRSAILESRNVFTDPRLSEIGKKYKKCNAQVALRWQLQRGVCVIPKSVTADRIHANANIWDFKLDSEDMAAIEAMNENLRVCRIRYKVLHSHPEYPF